MNTATAALVKPVALAFEGSEAPDWIQIMPSGQWTDRVGRSFRMTNPQAVLAAFVANNAPIPIDVEHATGVRAREGLDAPAYGWIEEMEERQGQIWGRVDWTEKGAELVATRAYRFVSPQFAYAAETGEVLRIIAVGLTNTPAFEMEALAREGQEQENEMDRTVLEALGLNETATAAQAVAAIEKLKGDVTTATARADTPDPERFVPKAQLDAANSKIKEFEDEATARDTKAIEDAVDAAIEAGKIVPATRDYNIAAARASGLDDFTKAVETMPVIAGASDLDTKGKGKGATATASALTEDEITVATQLGQTAEEFAEAKAKETK